MSETRKLAAILVTDVVGCSSLMSEHEAGAAPQWEHRKTAPPLVRGLD